ncbi:MAG: outer membrane protein transport protein, partial [Ignavibacteriaceae bacterium]|nr:outer membrane protein transport protein [Ignavibacteriaceae bacterium]
ATGKFIQQEYHSQIALMQGGLTAAYRLSENLSVGASLHLVYSTLEFAMPYSLKPSIMKGMAMPGMTFGQMFAAPPQMGGFGYDEVTAYAKMSDLTALGFNGKIGIAYKVNENLSIGLNYSSPITLTYKDGKADMDMTAQLMDGFGKAVMGYMMQNPGSTQQQAQGAIMSQFAQMGIDLSKGAAATYDMEAELSFPQSFGFGLSYKINRDFMVAADFEYLNWADAFDKMSLKLSNGNNPNINKMIGSSSMNIDFPMNWENSLLIKVGVEYNATPDLALRVGFANGANPVPSSTIFSIFPAVVENHITAGLSYKVSAPLTINAALEMGLENSVDGSKPHVLAHEYEGSTSTLSTTLLHLGVSYNL